MNTGGYIFITVAWVTILILLIFSFVKILKK